MYELTMDEMDSVAGGITLKDIWEIGSAAWEVMRGAYDFSVWLDDNDFNFFVYMNNGYHMMSPDIFPYIDPATT